MVEPVGSFAALRRSEAARPWPFAIELVKVGQSTPGLSSTGGRPSTASRRLRTFPQDGDGTSSSRRWSRLVIQSICIG